MLEGTILSYTINKNKIITAKISYLGGLTTGKGKQKTFKDTHYIPVFNSQGGNKSAHFITIL